MSAEPEVRTVEPLRGWLILYLVALVVLALHGLGLTIASLIIKSNPSLVGLDSFVKGPSLAFYVATNIFLVLYTVVIFILMFKRKRSAIPHNVVFNVLSVVFLVCWHFLGMKSTVGTLIDSVPGIVMGIYILTSRRVRRTFTR
jgi:hypothetical protein